MQTTNILSKLKTMMPFLSSTEQKLGQYILDHPADILSMSTKELASNSEVSEATIIRFSRKLDVNGYKELKLQLSADLASDDTYNAPVDLSKKDSTLEIYKKLAAFATASIDHTSKTLNEQDLDAAVELICKTVKKRKQIYLNGMGTSSLLAKEFQVKLMRLNIPSVFYEDSHLRLESCSLMKKDDLFICFTALGKSTQNHQLIELAKKRGAHVLLITQYGNTKLAENATITLYTSIIENNLRLISQTSFTVQSIIIDALFLGIALKNYSRIQSEVQETREVFSELGFYTN
jgi:DNA-binding MurR/RpiR family transcriptional regulator